MPLLGWEVLIFAIPLAVGVLLALGAALGVLETGEGEAGGEGHLDEGGSGLELGRLPLSIRLMLVTLPFGSLGLAVTYLVGGLGQPGGVRAALALGLAAAGTWWVARGLGALLRERVRLVESETVARRDLVGSVGRAVLSVGVNTGLAQVKDRHGNLHQVGCRTLRDDERLPPGSPVLVVEYDEARKICYVCKSPSEEATH